MASSPQADDRETGEKFYKFFQSEAALLRQNIDRLGDTGLAGGERNDATEYCIAGIQRLSDQVKDASVYIPARDQKTYLETLKALQTHLGETRETHAPKPKFSFKSARKRPSATSLSDAAAAVATKEGRLTVPVSHSHAGSPLASSAESSVAPTPAQIRTPPNELASGAAQPDEDVDDFDEQDIIALARKEAQIRKLSFSQAASIAISRQSHSHIILPPSAAHATTTGSLSQLRRCVIDMSVPTLSAEKGSGRPFAGLTLKNIRESLLVCGRVDGATHVTGLKDCVVVVECRQLRMHECERCDVYLRVAGRPIIEDCAEVRFAPLPAAYENDGHADKVENQWDQVDDFKWLDSEPSPNWKVMPAEDRVENETWTKTVPGEPGIGVSDILLAVGVKKK